MKVAVDVAWSEEFSGAACGVVVGVSRIKHSHHTAGNLSPAGARVRRWYGRGVPGGTARTPGTSRCPAPSMSRSAALPSSNPFQQRTTTGSTGSAGRTTHICGMKEACGGDHANGSISVQFYNEQGFTWRHRPHRRRFDVRKRVVINEGASERRRLTEGRRSRSAARTPCRASKCKRQSPPAPRLAGVGTPEPPCSSLCDRRRRGQHHRQRLVVEAVDHAAGDPVLRLKHGEDGTAPLGQLTAGSRLGGTVKPDLSLIPLWDNRLRRREDPRPSTVDSLSTSPRSPDPCRLALGRGCARLHTGAVPTTASCGRTPGCRGPYSCASSCTWSCSRQTPSLPEVAQAG